MRRLVLVAALGLALGGCGGQSGQDAATTEAEVAGADSAEPLDAVVRTTHGTFTISLDTERSPRTTASFAELARRGFFDGTVFHRIAPGFVIQGGDPTGTGTGGPGSTTTEPPPRDLRYTRGVVAMAKAGGDPPGTAGSQFFVVTTDDAGLPPEYALLGEVSEGLDVVERIGELGDPATERPRERVAIERVTIRPG